MRRALFLAVFFLLFGICHVSSASAVEVGAAEPFAWGATADVNYRTGIAEAGLNRMHELGLTWHREWISWKDWQTSRPAGGNANLDESAIRLMDNVVDLSQSNGISTYAMIYNSPAWANGSSDSVYIPGNGDPDNPDYRKFVEDYGNFVYEVVSRYRGRIDHWEIWNEPDLEGYWRIDDTPQDFHERIGGQARGYAYMLQVAYSRAKEANPDAVVVIGGITAYTAPWFLSALYDHGAGSSFDVVGVHPYTLNVKPSVSPYFARLGSIQNTMAANGDANKPIWITETGWSSRGTLSPSRTVTEEQQAEYAVDALTTVQAMYPSVEVLTFFRMMDRGDWYNSQQYESGMGMLYTDVYTDGVYTGHALHEPKPMFYAIKTKLAELNTQAPIQMSLANVYWESYQKYISRELAVGFNLKNEGSSQFKDVSITQVYSSRGIASSSTFPLLAGNILPGESRLITIRYYVPAGITSFKTALQGEAVDMNNRVWRFPS